MLSATLHRGHVFHLAGNPGAEAAPAALREHPDGGLLVDDRGRILACGPVRDLAIPDGTRIETHAGAFLLPGFVDCHVHFPQVHVPDSFGGGQLLEWLDRCVFPAEARFADPAFARDAAAHFCDALLGAGTTCALVYGSQFPAAQEALFEELGRRGMRAVVGRTTMVKGPPAAAPLLSPIDESIRLCREEIGRWHPAAADAATALVHVALIPRFALSLDVEAFRRLGELWAEVRDRGVRFSTHLSENDRPGDGEIEQVLRTFQVGRYLDVYDGLFLPGSRRGGESFLGPRSVFAHAVHVTGAEVHRLAESGSAVAHCPVSQLFLGSGTMPWRTLRAAGIRVGAGTDVGAGDTFAIPEVLNSAYKVHMGAGTALHPAEVLHLGTLGGAQALALDDRVGNFDAGKEADFLVVSAAGDPLLARRLEAAPSTEARLFTLLMGLRPRHIREVRVRGREPVFDRPEAGRPE